MALLVVNQGEVIALEALVNKTAPQDLRLKLFKNNWTPIDGDTESNATVADFTGYSDIDLDGVTWTSTPGAPSHVDYPQQTFTSSDDQVTQNVYGYYVVQQTSGKLVWAERFSNGPYAITNDGDMIKVTLKLEARKAGE